MADKHGLIFQIHVAETYAECEMVREKHHTTPVGYLELLGLIDSNCLLVHGVWLEETDIAVIAKRKAAISHNPESNMKLAAGIAPLTRLQNDGVIVGIGTDGCASNNNLDMFQEMDTAAKLHKVHQGDPALSSALQIAAMATVGGAAALNMADNLGSLEPGKKADLITVDLNQPHLTPMYEPCSHLVYAARGADVRDVIIDGRIVMRQRGMLEIDEQEVMAKVREIADIIRTRH